MNIKIRIIWSLWWWEEPVPITLTLTYIVKVMILKDLQQVLDSFHLRFSHPLLALGRRTTLTYDFHPSFPLLQSTIHTSSKSAPLCRGEGADESRRWESYVPDAERREVRIKSESRAPLCRGEGWGWKGVIFP